MSPECGSCGFNPDEYDIEKKQCGNCMYSREIKDSEELECLRFPPTAIRFERYVHVNQPNKIIWITRFPEMDFEDFCYEWKPEDEGEASD